MRRDATGAAPRYTQPALLSLRALAIGPHLRSPTLPFCAGQVTNVSVAMTGASMLMKGLIDLIRRIAIIMMPDQAATIVGTIAPIRTFVGYGIAGIGVVVQLMILKEITVEVCDAARTHRLPF